MLKHKSAIIQLLQDNDPETVRLVKNQLAWIEPVSDLKELLNVDDALVTAHVQEVLANIQQVQALKEFNTLCHRFNTDSDLENACWALARAWISGLDTRKYKPQLDIWGDELADLIRFVSNPRERILILSDYFSNTLGFKGNFENYYHASNSILPTVIDSRRGIPITLAILNILLGQRAGMKIEGINLPGHFIVRHEGHLFDPYHGGRILTRTDCEEILTRQLLPLNHIYLEPADNRSILIRVIANLLYIIQQDSEPALEEKLTNWIKILSP